MISDEEILKCKEAVDVVMSYLETNENKNLHYQASWYDKDSDHFSGDLGYFFEGLENFKKYLEMKGRK